MNLQQLRVFVLAVKLQKLHLVASALGVSQPTVTFHLQRLQREAGVPLFAADTFRTLQLTEAGQGLLYYAERITAMQAEAETVLAQFKNLRGARVSIGCTYTPATYMLPSLLAQLNADHPGLVVALDVAPAHVVADKVKRFELDMGLVSEVGFSDPEIEKRPLLREDLVLTFHPEHPLADRPALEPGDLAGHPYVSHEATSLSRALIDGWASEHGLRLETTLEVAQTEAMKEAVRHGIGFAMISGRCLDRDVQSGSLVTRPIPEWTFERYISLIRRPDKLVSPAMGIVLAALTAVFAEEDAAARVG